MAERTETGRGRPAEPATRWRALLDRALLGRNNADEYSPDEREYDGRFGEPGAAGPDERQRPDGGYPANGARPLDAPPRGYDAAPAPDHEAGSLRDHQAGSLRDHEYEPRPMVRDYAGSPGHAYAPAPRDPAGSRRDRRGGTRRTRYPDQIEWQHARTADPAEQMVQVLRQEITSPRVLAFANPKGGVHKTTATALAAATIGSVRGRGVLAWDDNELRGTLGLRAGIARHARTVRHLIADLARVESYSGYELRDRLDDYLRHANDGSYDVLAGEENPRFAQRLDPHTVRRVLELMRRTHDIICVDTGNNVESPNWQTVLQTADQLIVTSVPREDAAFTADWMLDLLDEAGMEELVANAVTLLSCPTPNPTPLIDDLAAHFRSRTRAVVVVPYDAALESGSNIEYEMLTTATKRAWLRAAAVMLDPYAR